MRFISMKQFEVMAEGAALTRGPFEAAWTFKASGIANGMG